MKTPEFWFEELCWQYTKCLENTNFVYKEELLGVIREIQKDALDSGSTTKLNFQEAINALHLIQNMHGESKLCANQCKSVAKKALSFIEIQDKMNL